MMCCYSGKQLAGEIRTEHELGRLKWLRGCWNKGKKPSMQSSAVASRRFGDRRHFNARGHNKLKLLYHVRRSLVSPESLLGLYPCPTGPLELVRSIDTYGDSSINPPKCGLNCGGRVIIPVLRSNLMSIPLCMACSI